MGAHHLAHLNVTSPKAAWGPATSHRPVLQGRVTAGLRGRCLPVLPLCLCWEFKLRGVLL